MRGAGIAVVVGGSALAACGGAGAPVASSDAAPGGAPADASSLVSDAGPATLPPVAPTGLVHWLVGNDADAEVTPGGPGLIIMGGDVDVSEAFDWWVPRVAGGDVVVLRTSGADGYNDYLYETIGGVDSVETLRVDTRALADSDYVAWRLAHAEGVFIAGGDQATYLAGWKDTRVETALATAWSRGAIVGGTSAGCAVLGEFVFAAERDSIGSADALADPYDPSMTLTRDFLAFPPLAGVITDSHFRQTDRLGRLIAFQARLLTDGWSERTVGLGLDEATALVVDATGHGLVLGDGAAYVVTAPAAPDTCSAGQALTWRGLSLYRLVDGQTVTLPAGTTAAPAVAVSVDDGVLTPAAY